MGKIVFTELQTKDLHLPLHIYVFFKHWCELLYETLRKLAQEINVNIAFQCVQLAVLHLGPVAA